MAITASSRAAGMSAWQFTAPSLVVALGVGIIATTVYNPIAAILQEKAKRMEAELSGNNAEGLQATVNGFWVSQRSDSGQSIINASGSRDQGVLLTKVSAFVFDQSNHFIERVESATASLQSGHWRLEDARVYAPGAPPDEREFYLLATNLTPEQVRETLSTPETVPFWQLPYFIDMAKRAGLTASGYQCNIRSCWRGHSCWRPWCCSPQHSASGFSAWAACKRWFWAGSPRASCSTSCRS